VAHTCNNSYLEDWDQEDCGSRPTWAKNMWDPISTDSWVRCYMPIIPAMARSIKLEDHGTGWPGKKSKNS
jgi:hypothetical protein